MTLSITKPKPFCFVLMPFDAAFEMPDFDVVLRLFSADGYRDFPLGFRHMLEAKT